MRMGETPKPEALEKLQEYLALLDAELKKTGHRFVTGDNITVADQTLACAIASYK